MDFLENISLKEFTTFKIGGKAKHFIRIKQIHDLQIAIAFAQSRNLPVFVLGGGSNILVSDQGYSGLVIKMEIIDTIINPEKDGSVIVSAGAGINWDSLVEETVKNGLHGLENLSLIPGTVGAAPVQNIGAYGVEVKEVIEWVEALDMKTGEMRHFKNSECMFNYRNSFFKTPEGKKYIITRVGFKLSQNAPLNTSYKDIALYIKEQSISDSEITLQKVRDIVIDIRTKKLPNLAEYGTAGSFFKNPIISKKEYESLKKTFPELPGWTTTPPRGLGTPPNLGGDGEVLKVSAAWILDNLCGFKGFKDEEVGVYKNQALVLVNFGKGTAADIKNLAQKMIDCVQEKTNIILEREVEYI